VISDSLNDGYAAQRDPGARPFIKRRRLSWNTGVQSGNGAGDQRVVIGHLYSTLGFP
jgi:hypothetical protein